MVVPSVGIISKSAYDIMNLAYRDLKLGNVLRAFFIRKPLFARASVLLT